MELVGRDKSVEGKVRQAELVGFSDEVRVSSDGFIQGHSNLRIKLVSTRIQSNQVVPDIVISTSRAEFNSNVIAKDRDKFFENFEAEPCTVLDTASPFVCAMVGGGVQELSDYVAICAMH